MPVPRETRKIQRLPMREDVYRLLHQWIIDGTLQPGEQMQDTMLAKRLGVSRTPVREALRRLTDEGLIETSPQRWTRVAPVSVADAHNHFPILWALERLALELQTEPFTAAELHAMAERNGALDAALNDGMAVEASKRDYQFHHLLLLHCHNPELSDIIENQRMKLRRISITYFDGCIVAKHSVIEHNDVIEALGEDDYAKAALMIEGHWRDSYSRFLDQSAPLSNGPGA